MARPIKEHLDYFPLDTNFYQNRKIKRLLRAQGSKALAVWIVIMCSIYGDKGYYLNYDDNTCFDISDTLGISESAVNEIVNLCIKYGLFDEQQFAENKILTSKGIQEQYQEIIDSLRRANEMDDDFLVNDVKTEVNATETIVNDVKSTQKKRKEKKLKEMKRKSDIAFSNSDVAENDTELLFDEFWEQYPKKVGKSKAIKSFEKLEPTRGLLDKMIDALNVQKLSRQWQDISFIPNPTTWLNQRRFDDDLEAYKNSSANEKTSKRRDLSIDEREYTEEELRPFYYYAIADEDNDDEGVQDAEKV